jgi:hypothetical protein
MPKKTEDREFISVSKGEIRNLIHEKPGALQGETGVGSHP